MKKIKLLIIFLLSLFGIFSFSFADEVYDLIQKICPDGSSDCDYLVQNVTVSNSSWITLYDFGSSNPYQANTLCFKFTNFSQTTSVSDIFVGFTNGNSSPYTHINYTNTENLGYYCIGGARYFKAYISAGASPITFDVEMFSFSDLLTTALPELSSLQCQTKYNLIPIDSIDINYCVENQLCPNESGTGDFSGDLQFSNIYINDILHPGKQNIFVNIPDYIMWDYNVVGDDFNIYVGSGYDVDYINSVIDINSYRPTSSDFTNVFVGGLTLIFPYIVIVLFIVFIRKLIKRIFK